MISHCARAVIRVLSILLVTVGLAACEPNGDDPPEDPATDTPDVAGFTAADLEEGERLVRESGCFVCHGSDLEGTALAPGLLDLQVDADRAGVERISAFIVRGTEAPDQYPTRMPPRGGAPLDDEEVRLVSAYLVRVNASGQ